MCIVIICCPDCDVINLEIKLSLLIKPFSYMTKKSGQKCKCLENEKNKKHFSSFHQKLSQTLEWMFILFFSLAKDIPFIYELRI